MDSEKKSVGFAWKCGKDSVPLFHQVKPFKCKSVMKTKFCKFTMIWATFIVCVAVISCVDSLSDSSLVLALLLCGALIGLCVKFISLQDLDEFTDMVERKFGI
jgi:hypothetical protein